MPDLLQWTSALLALVGLLLWFWSAHPVAPFKRQIRRAAIFAALVSALLQVGIPASRTQLNHIVLWASLTSPVAASPIG